MAFSVDVKRAPVRSGYARGGHRIGAMLDQLRRESFHVLQGVELTDEGSIDYLVMGPTGVFTIATRRHIDGNALAAARRQAAKLREVLDVAVTPLICPPGRQGRTPFQHEGVWIVRRDELVTWLRSQDNDVLEFVRFARFADRL